MFSSLTSILFVLSLFVLAAVLARWMSGRIGQPSVLAELLIGVLVGNVGLWFGIPFFELIMNMEGVGEFLGRLWQSELNVSELAHELAAEGVLSNSLQTTLSDSAAPRLISVVHVMWILSHLGVLLLLFNAGLESSVGEMKRVGKRASAVAIIGIVAPFVLAFVSCLLLHVEMDLSAHAFLAATLSATSVGISARVFEDLGDLGCPEAKVIMGAAVIDDILGLVLLAVVVGIVTTGTVEVWSITYLLLVAAGFLGATLLFGEKLAGWGAHVFQKLDTRLNKLFYPLFVMLALAWLTESIQLASIIGAFTAGLVINDNQFQGNGGSVREQIIPLERFLSPIFFILVGMQVNVKSFLDPTTLILAAVLTVAAVIGKLVAGWAVSSELNRTIIGWGMVPRGEVGLVFLGIGKGLGVVTDSVFSALVIVVIVTTLITPPALKWAMAREP